MRPLGQRTGVLLLAFAMFVVTMSLRFFATPEDAVLTLLTVPVAVIAFEFGWRAGVVAAVIATLWVVVWNQLYLSPLGYFARGATYVLDRPRRGPVRRSAAGRTGGCRWIRATSGANSSSSGRSRSRGDRRTRAAGPRGPRRDRAQRQRDDGSVDRRAAGDGPYHGGRPPRSRQSSAPAETRSTELRRVLSVLRPAQPGAALNPQRGIEDLERLAEQIRSAGVDVRCGSREAGARVPAALDLSVYRIAQEALTNTLKHAAAHSAAVIVRYGDDTVEVECTDDGSGATAHSNGATGHGLIGMRERALSGRRDRLRARNRMAATASMRACRSIRAHDVVRILIADDQHLVRSGFRMMLESEDGIEVVAEAADGRRRVGRPPAAARRGPAGPADAGDGRHRGDTREIAGDPALAPACSWSPPSTRTSTCTRRYGRGQVASCSRMRRPRSLPPRCG